MRLQFGRIRNTIVPEIASENINALAIDFPKARQMYLERSRPYNRSFGHFKRQRTYEKVSNHAFY
jgi:hypothetical protein